MPKIIAGVKEKIISATCEIIARGDYSGFSARQIASSCSIAVGTLYNYFPSMESLMVTIIGDEWCATLAEMDERCKEATSVAEGLDLILRGIRRFTEKYIKFWTSAIRSNETLAIGGSWHLPLREEISARILSVLERFGYTPKATLLPAMAEIIISLGAGCNIELEVASELVMTVAERCCRD